MSSRYSYKQTPIGKIPEDWEVVELGDKNITDDLFYGITAKAVEKDTGLRMLRTTDIKNYSVNWNTLPFCEITEKRKEIEKYLLKKGDIIVARAGTVGISVLIERDFNNIIFGSYLIKVKLKPNVDAKFVHYFFQSSIYWKQLQKAQGSTVKNINLPLLSSLKIPLPPLPEQKAIAQILSTVDEAIQKVDEIIAKTERLKKGLMQKLLTKGIGHKEFKDSEIGRIPKEWEVVKLSEVANVRRGASPRPKGDPRYFGGSIPWIKISDLTKYKKTIYLQATDDTITKEGKKRSLYLPDGSLIISNSGTIGEPAIIATGRGGCIHDGFIYIAPLIHRVDKFFLYYFFEFKKTKLQARAQKGTQENLNTSIWKSIRLPCPHLPEQQKIAEILSTVDKKLELERKRKEKLERIKKGLMNDLLTGKKRVKIK